MKSSKTGYKKSSKDKKEPILKIPSNRITMKDVSHPVLAILEDGGKHIMYPEQEYYFPNTSSVIEIPLKMKNKKQKGGLNQFEFYLSSLKEEDQDELIGYMDSLSLEDQMKFLHGGKVVWKKYQQGGMSGMVPVEVEGEETVKTLDGNLYEFEGPKHSEGGIDVVLEAGSKIFSEHLKAPKEVVKAVLGKDTKKKYSYADLSKKFDTTKWTKILEDENSDVYELETAKLKLASNNAMLETIFEAQEMVKNKKGNKSNPLKAQKGAEVGPTETPLERLKRIYGEPTPEFTWEGWGMRQIGNNPKNKKPWVSIQNPENTGYSGELDYQFDMNRTQFPWREPSSTVSTGQVLNNTDRTFLPPAQELTIVDPGKNSVAPLPKGGKKRSSTGPKNTNTQTENNEGIAQIDPLSPLPTTNTQDRQVVSERGVPSVSDFSVSTEDTNLTEEEKVRKKFGFSVSPKLAGTIMDIGLAMSDKLNVRNPQYRDLRKTPLFSRFVDFEDKEAGRNYSLAIKQIQNSNQPQSVKNALINNLNAQYQDYQSKIDLAQNQQYQAKQEADIGKLQQYLDTNIDQHFQDIERYNQQKARVDFLKDQFNAQRKSRVVNALRGYLDYVDEVNMKNQILSDNYKVNPFSGKIQFKGEKKDPFAQYQQELDQYSQNSAPIKTLPGGAQFTMLGPGIGVVIDAKGETKIVELNKK